MNEIVNKFLLAGDNFMLEIDLTKITYSAVDHLQKNKERIQKFKETRDSQYIFQN